MQNMKKGGKPGAGEDMAVTEPFTPVIKLLLVEDDAVNQIILTEMLFQSGIEVLPVSRGEDALAAVRQDHFDMVLMDVQMPGMDGYETTRMIREWEVETGIEGELPIIAMTGYTRKEEWENCRRAGMNDFLSKPVDFTLLDKVMQKWILDKKMPESTSEPSHAITECIEISGIDVQMGMGQVNGNQSLFLNLVRDFIGEYLQLPERIRTLLAEGKAREIGEQLHRCKGVAGNLAARDIYRLCEKMEAVALGDVDPITFPALINTLEKEFLRMEESFHTVSPFLWDQAEEDVEPDRAKSDRAELDRVEPDRILAELEIIAQMISEQNVEVLNRMESFCLMLAGLDNKPLEDEGQKMVEMLYLFDFPSARQVLRKIGDSLHSQSQSGGGK